MVHDLNLSELWRGAERPKQHSAERPEQRGISTNQQHPGLRLLVQLVKDQPGLKG
jgi:hypothetical protein